MIELTIVIAATILVADIYVGLSRRTRKMEFRFSRYSMFNMRPGRFQMTLSKQHYNLPENSDVECEFTISPDGHLDNIRPCDNIMIGGSTAFGVGSPGNSQNITGVLRNKYKLDVLNLAIPGWNIEQEVITLLRHIVTINPKKIVFLDGANNLSLALPFNYHGERIHPDALAFYGEDTYEKAINQHFDSVQAIGRRFKALLKEVLRHSLIARAGYRVLGPQNTRKVSIAEKEHIDVDVLANVAVQNYLEWMRIFVEVASSRGIEVHCVLQPYYAFGRDMAAVGRFNFYNVNPAFDDYMISAYNKLDSALLVFKGIIYHPLFREMATESVGLFTDAVHLNDRGYELVADKLNSIFMESSAA